MNIILFRKFRMVAMVMLAVFFLTSVVLPPTSSAQKFKPKRPPKRHHRPFYPPHGHRIKVLPPGHRPIHFGPSFYFFTDGIFYRQAIDGYEVVIAPVGAIVPLLPAAAVLITIGALSYYTYADVYYQKVPEGYMVVAPPVSPPQSEKAIAWEGDQIRVTVPVLNVRSGPGEEHPTIKELHEGDILVVQSSSSEWYYVKLPDNSFGWVMVKFTTLVKPKGVG
jgi:hypothetical protein